MILTFLLSILYFLITRVIYFLPTGNTLPTDATTAITSLGNASFIYNSIFPVDTLFTIIGLTLTTIVLVNGFKIGMWIAHYMRGTSYHSKI